MKKIEMFAIAAVAVCVMASCDGKKSNKTWSQEEDLDETELVEDDEEAGEAEASNEIDVAPDELWTEEAVSDVLRRDNQLRHHLRRRGHRGGGRRQDEGIHRQVRHGHRQYRRRAGAGEVRDRL